MTVEGLYYVKDVQPAHLRLVGLLSSTERSLPQEFCTKLNMNDLSQLQFALQSKQLSKVHHRLVEANRFLHPDSRKAWSTLMTNKVVNDHNPAQISEADPELESLVQDLDDPDQNISKKMLRSGKSYFAGPVQLKPISHGKKLQICRLAPVPHHQSSAYKRTLAFADAQGSPHDAHSSPHCELHGPVCTPLEIRR